MKRIIGRLPWEWRSGLMIFLISRAILLLPAFVVQLAGQAETSPPVGHLFYHGGQPTGILAIDFLLKWDAWWFLNVARAGYEYHGVTPQGSWMLTGPETNVTVFPLLPVLIRLVSWDPLSAAISGLLICNISLLAGLVLLLKYLREIYPDEPLSFRTTLYFALFPTAFVYSSIYSEPLFLLAALLTLHFTRNERYVAATLSMIAATLSRPASIILVPAVLALAFEQRRSMGKAFNTALVAIGCLIGLGIYFSYLWKLTGHWDAYFIAQRGWHMSVAPPWKAITGLAQSLQSKAPYAEAPWDAGFILVTFLLLTLSIWTLPPHLALLWLGGMVLAVSSSSLYGFPRHVGILFPMFIPLGRLGASRPIHWAILGFFITFGIILSIAWFNWSTLTSQPVW